MSPPKSHSIIIFIIIIHLYSSDIYYSAVQRTLIQSHQSLHQRSLHSIVTLARSKASLVRSQLFYDEVLLEEINFVILRGHQALVGVMVIIGTRYHCILQHFWNYEFLFLYP